MDRKHLYNGKIVVFDENLIVKHFLEKTKVKEIYYDLSRF